MKKLALIQSCASTALQGEMKFDESYFCFKDKALANVSVSKQDECIAKETVGLVIKQA